VPEPEDRPASYNFIPDNKDEFLSVHWSERITPAEIFSRYPGCGLLEIPVADVWTLGYRVTCEPSESEDHAAIWGLRGAKTSALKKLRKCVTRSWRPGTSALVENPSRIP